MSQCECGCKPKESAVDATPENVAAYYGEMRDQLAKAQKEDKGALLFIFNGGPAMQLISSKISQVDATRAAMALYKNNDLVRLVMKAAVEGKVEILTAPDITNIAKESLDKILKAIFKE